MRSPLRSPFIGYDGRYYLSSSDWEKKTPMGHVFGGLTDIRPDGIHPSTDASLWLAEILHRDVVQRYGG